MARFVGVGSMMKMSETGLALLKDFEGCRLTAYPDITGVPTLGYGFTVGVNLGDTMTQAECDDRLLRELTPYESAVWNATGGNVTQNEFNALTSFSWNVGIAGMQKSSVIKAHNKGDKQAAARAFGLWNKAGGKPIAGLTRRRAAEAALYLTPDAGSLEKAEEPMPQGVDAPKPMTSSTTVIAGGTAAIATVTQIATQVTQLKDSVAGLGNWLIPALAVVALIAIGYVIYERFRNRARGAI
jgi:lysozyme